MLQIYVYIHIICAHICSYIRVIIYANSITIRQYLINLSTCHSLINFINEYLCVSVSQSAFALFEILLINFHWLFYIIYYFLHSCGHTKNLLSSD